MNLAQEYKQRTLRQKQQEEAQTDSKGNNPKMFAAEDVGILSNVKEMLAADLITLERANGAEERDPFKAKLIDKYREHATALMQSENWKDLTLVFWWLMWRLDIEGFDAVQADMLLGIKKGLNSPIKFKREYPTIYLDALNVQATAALEVPTYNTNVLDQAVEALNAGQMVTKPALKSKILVAHGKHHFKLENFETTVASLKQALALNDRAGVKTLLDEAQTKLSKHLESEAETE